MPALAVSLQRTSVILAEPLPQALCNTHDTRHSNSQIRFSPAQVSLNNLMQVTSTVTCVSLVEGILKC